MPKRSNQFQKAVTFIAEQLAPHGASVKESVELEEPGPGGVRREVDTLIEVNAGITRLRIAVESRDRTRIDDIQWVDDLIGKYSLLPVDRVLAISNSGFTAAAKQKAAMHSIELLTPTEVEETNWPARFQKPGIVDVRWHLDMVYVRFLASPPTPRAAVLDDVLVQDAGDSDTGQGTVRQLVEDIRPAVMQSAKQYLDKNLLTAFKTLSDLDSGAELDWTVPLSGLALVIEGTSYAVEGLEIRVAIRNQHTVVPVIHRALGEQALLSSGQVGESGEFSVLIAQMAGTGLGKGFIQRNPTGKKK